MDLPIAVKRRHSRALPWLIVILVTVAFALVAISVVKPRIGMKAIQTSKTWPMVLPVVTPLGSWYPERAAEARSVACNYIVSRTLNPDEADIPEAPRLYLVFLHGLVQREKDGVRITNGPTLYRIIGKVQTNNRFGAKVTANWSVDVALPKGRSNQVSGDPNVELVGDLVLRPTVSLEGEDIWQKQLPKGLVGPMR